MNVLELLIVVVILGLIGIFIGGALIEYSLEYWIGQIRQEPVDVPSTPCRVAGIFFGWNVGIPAGLITWIASSVWERPTE